MTAASTHETLLETVGTVELWTRSHLGRFAVGTYMLHCRHCGWDTYGGGYVRAVERAAAHSCDQRGDPDRPDCAYVGGGATAGACACGARAVAVNDHADGTHDYRCEVTDARLVRHH